MKNPPELEIRFVLSGGNMPNSLCCALIRCMRSFSVIPPLPSALRIRSCSGDSTSHMLPHPVKSGRGDYRRLDKTQCAFSALPPCVQIVSHGGMHKTVEPYALFFNGKDFCRYKPAVKTSVLQTQDSPKRSLSAAMSSSDPDISSFCPRVTIVNLISL